MFALVQQLRHPGVQALLHTDAATTRTVLAELLPRLSPNPGNFVRQEPAVTTFSRTATVTGAARGMAAAGAGRFAGDGLAVAVVDLDEVACRPVVDEIAESALGNRGQADCSAAKAGLLGFIETGMLVATAERMGVPFAGLSAAAAAQIPVACTGRPERVAHTVSYFASGGAGYVSGQVGHVAGGSYG